MKQTQTNEVPPAQDAAGEDLHIGDFVIFSGGDCCGPCFGYITKDNNNSAYFKRRMTVQYTHPSKYVGNENGDNGSSTIKYISNYVLRVDRSIVYCAAARLGRSAMAAATVLENQAKFMEKLGN